MIKCNRCGMMSAAGSVSCQSCGAPLSGQGEAGFGARMGASAGSQGQPELPAWLETLRPGERPAAPASSPSSFSTADFVEEGTLPSWMRAQRDDPQNTGEQTASGLRSAAQPAPTTDSGTFPSSAFTAQSLIDVQGLPSWMQEGNISMTPPPQSGASIPDQAPDWMKSLQPQQRPSVRDVEPAVSNEQLAGRVAPQEQKAPASGFSARDLIDQQSLPSWMNPGSTNQGPTGTNQGAPAAAPQQSGFSARDLIDQQDLPAWMVPQSGRGQMPAQPAKSEPAPPAAPNWDQPQAPQAAPGWNQPSQPSAPFAAQATPSLQPGQTGFSARDLVDQQSLPSWMSSQGNASQPQSPSGTGYDRAPAPQAAPGWNQPSQPSAPFAAQATPSFQPGQTGFSARDLVDQQSLPSWMSSQGEVGQPQSPSSQMWTGSTAQPVQPPPVSTPPQSGQGNFSASSLLDVNSLPSWLQNGGQPAAGNVAPPPSASAGEMPWGAPPTPSNAAGMAASSFIDPNALPEWMRTDAGQSGAGFQSGPGGQRPPAYTPGPPRAENMRVPNRPRGEVNANENSEVAANVFASMLGVASTAPNYPQSNPPASPVPPAGAGASYPPMGQPGMQQPGMGGRPAGPAPGAPGPVPQGQAYPPPTGANGYPSQAYPPSASAGGQYASNIGVPQYPPQMGGTANMGHMSDDTSDQKGKKKRGLFGSFLDWFSRDSQR